MGWIGYTYLVLSFVFGYPQHEMYGGNFWDVKHCVLLYN